MAWQVLGPGLIDGPRPRQSGEVVFYGTRLGLKPRVYRHDDSGLHPLDLRYDLRNHSPDGPNWGYGGSGPAQLALGLCCQVLPEHEAQALYQDFKAGYLSRLKADTWRLPLPTLTEAVLAVWNRERDRYAERAEEIREWTEDFDEVDE